MKKKMLYAAAALTALVVFCAGVLAMASPARGGSYSVALVAARQYLAAADPQQSFYPDGSFCALSDGMCRLGFVDSSGRPLSLTLWRDPVAHRYHVCGAVYADP